MGNGGKRSTWDRGMKNLDGMTNIFAMKHGQNNKNVFGIQSIWLITERNTDSSLLTHPADQSISSRQAR